MNEKIGLKQYREEFEALPLEWKISHILSKLKFPFMRHNYLFCSVADERQRTCAEIEKSIKECNKSYLISADTFTAKTLYNYLRDNNGKILFLSSPDLWWVAGVSDVLCGALNTTPAGKPWSVGYPGEQTFIFTGVLILLSNQPLKMLTSNHRLKYMLRDIGVTQL
ncbi:hypothetical protein [Sphingobacterium deserti]|uniref:Uncharacterized protein n=1 Tax=Sphingobacterium deserti TaxID=1229276 RepID=A0A0B8TAK0_9SPHI|nr:hypothetical protein [Sphingobacterium deserti]KGE15899.1 hypothetical protein DI53_0333 [Sphingobacterium deserti]